MNQVIDGEIAYTDVTQLDQEEKVWLLEFLFPDLYDLAPQVRLVMFNNLWTANTGTCRTCGADEGDCLNSTCIRTRVTNKLHLYERIT